MRNPFVALSAAIAAAMSQASAEAIKQSSLDGIRHGRGRNRFTPRLRIPGERQSAGTKIARMAAEARIGKRA